MRKPGIRCHRTTELDRKDTRLRQGLPVTSPARTLLDIAPTRSVNQLGWAVDEALTSGIMRTSQLDELLRRSSGHPGASILRTLCRQRLGPAPTRSDLEKLFVELIRSANLPEPETNVWLHGFLVDAFWSEQGVVFEIDSHRYHASKSAFERDRRKEAVLKSAGLDFNRLSDHQLSHEPYAVIAIVAQRLAARLTRAGAAASWGSPPPPSRSSPGGQEAAGRSAGPPP
jgi:very-short-patch-repair endonuclease